MIFASIRHWLRRRALVKAARRQQEEMLEFQRELAANHAEPRGWSDPEHPSPITKWVCESCGRGPFLGVKLRVCPRCRSKRVRESA